MNLKEIKGQFLTTNVSAVRNIDDRRALYEAFEKSRIRHLIKFNIDRERVGFQIDHAQLVEGTHEEALEFIESIQQVLQSEASVKFNFTGEFTVNIEAEQETITFLITVKKQKVSYQETEFIWPKQEQNEA